MKVATIPKISAVEQRFREKLRDGVCLEFVFLVLIVIFDLKDGRMTGNRTAS